MPKVGFASITVGDVIYDQWFDFYHSRKTNFQKQGINSLAGLISAILDAVMKKKWSETDRTDSNGA